MQSKRVITKKEIENRNLRLGHTALAMAITYLKAYGVNDSSVTRVLRFFQDLSEVQDGI